MNPHSTWILQRENFKLVFLSHFQDRLLQTNVTHINLCFSSCSSPCKKNLEKSNVLRRSCKQSKNFINLRALQKEIRDVVRFSRLHKCITKSFISVQETVMYSATAHSLAMDHGCSEWNLY